MEDVDPEPWLRVPIEGIPAMVMPVFFSFQLVREDLAKHTAGLAEELVWHRLPGGSLGFHLKHIAGSVERLSTYLAGEQITEQQLQFLKDEDSESASLAALLTAVHEALWRAEQKLLRLDPQTLYAARFVGRKRLPTTVIGLLVHLAEHTQRHLGQAITVSKFLRQLS